jgi:hypothetical protein
MASSSLSVAASNAEEGGKHIQYGFVDFVPHPPLVFLHTPNWEKQWT